MMRRLVGLFCIAGMGVFMMVLLGACQHKDLFFDDHYQLVDVNIHWEDGVIPPPKGMRVEFYTLHDMSTEIGTEDFASSYGGKLRMLPSSEYHILCYDYLGSENNKIKHNREFDQAQVYTNSYNRASYSRAFPDELLVTQPDPFYMSKIDDYNVYRWKEGLYCFKNKPFARIMEDLERYYDLKIQLDKKSIEGVALTGKFRISDGLDYALRVLQKDVAFTYRRDKDNDVIYIK